MMVTVTAPLNHPRLVPPVAVATSICDDDGASHRPLAPHATATATAPRPHLVPPHASPRKYERRVSAVAVAIARRLIPT